MVACALLIASPVVAAPSARLVYLRNPGAETCPSEEKIRAAVAARLGYDPFFPSAPSTMFVELAKQKDGFSARMKLVDDQNTVRGTRNLVFRGERCDEIVDAVALSVSIAIDPDSLVRKAEPPPAPDPPSRPPEPEVVVARPGPPPAADRPPTVAPKTPIGETVRLDIGAFGSAWAGAAPAPNVSVSAALAARLGRASLALEGRYDAPASLAAGGGEVFTNLAGAVLVPCFHTAASDVTALALCGEAFVGVMRAGSRDVSDARTDTDAFAALGPRVGLTIPLAGAVSVYGHVNAMAPVGTKAVTLGGATVWESSPIAGSVAVGLRAKVF